MSPRIVGCLFFSIVAGIAAFVWAVSVGWGVLLGLLAYSLVGSVCLVLAASALAALESALAGAQHRAPARSHRRYATAHSG